MVLADTEPTLDRPRKIAPNSNRNDKLFFSILNTSITCIITKKDTYFKRCEQTKQCGQQLKRFW